MRIVTIAVFLTAVLATGRLAQAQPAEETPTPAPPVYSAQPQPHAYPYAVPIGCVPGATDARCLKQILEADPAYRAAKSRRTTGIVLTAVGSSLGVMTMVVAGIVALVKSLESVCLTSGCPPPRYHTYTSEKIASGVGAGLVIVGVAAGVPMITSGSREMRVIRTHYLNQVPRPALSFGRQHALLSTTWSF
jgi:hypothetical protein